MSEQGNALPVTKPGWGELLSGRNGIHSLALAGSVALHALNIYIATTIMPSVVAEIGGIDYYAWSTTLFVVASILGAALSARLLNRAGARNAYGFAATLFVIGTLVVSLAPDMPVLLGGRFIQGLGGGFLYALAYGVIRLILPERMWARAIALISATWGVATLIGPAVGGVFAEIGAWRAAFWALIPFAILFAALAFATLPKAAGNERDTTTLPLAQLILLTATVLALSAGSLGNGTAWSLSSIAVALVLFGSLIAVESQARIRLLPRGALKVATPLGAPYATVALLVGGMQPEIYIPYLLQMLHGQSPLMAGYLAALMAIGWTLGSILSADWTADSRRRIIIAGPVLGLAALMLLAIFLPVERGGQWAVLGPVCVGLVIVGLGIGLAWPHLVTQIFRAAPEGEQELAAAGVTTVQLFASALGAGAAGTIANLAGVGASDSVPDIANAAFWLPVSFALAPALGLVTAWLAGRSETIPRSLGHDISDILKEPC